MQEVYRALPSGFLAKKMNNLTTYKWSISEWHELVETGMLEGKPVELLEGEIIKVSPEGIEHFYTSDSVADYLRELLRGQAKIFEAHPITLDNSEPEPDLAIVRLPKTIYRKHLPSACKHKSKLQLHNVF